MAQIDIKQIRGASQGSILFIGTQSVVRESSNLNFDPYTNKFTITGSLRYVDGNQNEGYVLVSDSQGNVSWTENIKFGNGLSQIGITAGIGGTLSYDTTIHSNNFTFSIEEFSTILLTGSSVNIQLFETLVPDYYSYPYPAYTSQGGTFLLDTGTAGFVNIYTKDILNYASGDMDILVDNNLSISANAANITTTNGEGFVYTQDYSGTFVTNSLVTKKYVDSLNFSVGTENGLTSNNGLIGLGGTLSRNTTISSEAFDFTIDNFDLLTMTGSSIDVQLTDGYFLLDVTSGSVDVYAQQILVLATDSLDLSAVQFAIDTDSASITTNNNEGLVYTQDYSGTFVTNSLVTKKYVDSLNFNVGTENGLTSNGGLIGIGGTLSRNTTISAEGFDFQIEDFDTFSLTGSLIDIYLEDGDFILDTGNNGNIDLYSGQTTIWGINTLDLLTSQFSLDSTTASITTLSLEGLVYTQDYSGTFVTNSLVSKKYADSLVKPENGLTSNNGFIGLGGTLSRNTNISAENFNFTLDNFDVLSLTGSSLDIQLFDGYFILDAHSGTVDIYGQQMLLYATSSIDIATTQFTISSESGTITTNNLEGLVYTQDYSGTFVTNSLVSKKYVDSQITSSGATNGISKIGDFLGLGGTISQDTKFKVENFDVSFEGFDTFGLTGSIIDIQLYEGDFFLDTGTSGSVNVYSEDIINYASVNLSIISDDIFTITTNNSLVTTLNGEGLVYSQDYSGSFVTNSLVSKKYVDSLNLSVNTENGLTFSGGVIGLGGTLSRNTTIGSENFNLTIDNFDILTLTGSVIDTQLYNGQYILDVGNFGSVDIYSGDTTIYSNGNLDLVANKNITLTTNTASVTTLNGEGIVYSLDYSGTFVTNSLVSKNYVDNLISATNGLTFLNNTITLGGNLSANTTIQSAGYDFTIEDFDTLVLTGSSVDIQIPEGSFILDTDDSGTVDIWSGNILFYADDSIDVDVNNEFVINSGTFSVTTTNNLGIVYTNDYSATFVTHSLVTKKYVDDQIGSIGGNTQSLNTSLISSIGTGTNTIYSFATASYSGAFIDYTLTNESNARAGNISAIWLGTEIKFVEVSTMDIGTTAGLTFSFIISGTYAVLQAESSSNWQLKTIIRSI